MLEKYREIEKRDMDWEKKERKEGGEKKKIGQSQLATIALRSTYNGLLEKADSVKKRANLDCQVRGMEQQQKQQQ